MSNIEEYLGHSFDVTNIYINNRAANKYGRVTEINFCFNCNMPVVFLYYFGQNKGVIDFNSFKLSCDEYLLYSILK